MQQEFKQGFTLIEIMIVLVIIGLMSGVIVLNVGSSNYSGFMADASKIANALEIVADEAAYTNSVIACDVNFDGFICQAYKNGDWRELNLKNLVAWAWPNGIRIERVYINGQILKDNEKIRFYPHGDIDKMSFQISNGVHKVWIDGDMNGVFVINN